MRGQSGGAGAAFAPREHDGGALVLDDVLGLGLPLPERFYHQMMLIRTVEERLLELFTQGVLSGTTHTSIGQEANAVGVLNAIDRDRDIIWSNHRCHGHFIAYAGHLEGLIAEIMGRATGVSGGRGGSQHLCYKRFRSNGIQGGIAPAAVGGALARRAEGAIATVFLGDGTMGEGAVYESLNLAAVLGAPVLFVVEDNGIAQTTPSALTVSGSIAARADAFGIRSFSLDSSDPLAVHALATTAVDHVRSAGAPAWLHLKTERIGPHSKGDDTRNEWQLAQARSRDPLALMRPRIPNAAAIDVKCRALVAAAVAVATAAPPARG